MTNGESNVPTRVTGERQGTRAVNQDLLICSPERSSRERLWGRVPRYVDIEGTLVVVNDTGAHRELLKEAGELARGIGTELVLFSWATPEEVSDDAETLAAVEAVEHPSYSGTDALDVVENFARKLATEVLGEDSAEFDVTVAVADDDLADEILDAAQREGRDHVFIVGRRRSPTG